tara:strand:- start:459 stop:845 length:387 start_codon:yes stop_codon:yes gene_type:complete
MSDFKKNFSSSPSGVSPVKAWLNFDGTDADITATMKSEGIDSVTDNGTGDYTINFTTAFSDLRYGMTTGCGASSNTARGNGTIGVRLNNAIAHKTIGWVRVACFQGGGSTFNAATMNPTDATLTFFDL